MSGERTLAVVMGQLRAASVTWENFQRNVLEECGADLAVCTPADDYFDAANPFYRNAKHRWILPTNLGLSNIYDQVQRYLGTPITLEELPDWKVVNRIPGPWLGGVNEDRSGTKGAIEFLLRWWVFDNVRASGMLETYDRFILTRSDLFYLAPHPPLVRLSEGQIWIPGGEDYWGLNPRHVVVAAQDLAVCCSMVERIVSAPGDLLKEMTGPFWNVEKALQLNLRLENVDKRIRRFPSVMLLVRTDNDYTTTTNGQYESKIGAYVKYGQEFAEAKRFSELIRSRSDWERYFEFVEDHNSVRRWRVHTFHHTILYFDENVGWLRHGPYGAVALNIDLRRIGDKFFIIYTRSDGEFILEVEPHGRGIALLPMVDEAKIIAADFRTVPFKGGEWPAGWLWASELFGLQSQDLFLAAEPDGGIILNRTECNAWEQFRLVPTM